MSANQALRLRIWQALTLVPASSAAPAEKMASIRHSQAHTLATSSSWQNLTSGLTLTQVRSYIQISSNACVFQGSTSDSPGPGTSLGRSFICVVF